MEYYRQGCYGERHRYKSKGEQQLALFFEGEGFSYRYEQALAVTDRGKVKIWYPDFWLRDFGIVVEYFGVNGQVHYDEQVRHKMDVYSKNGIEGLFLTEDSLKGDWPVKVMGQIEEILKNRLERFYSRHGG